MAQLAGQHYVLGLQQLLQDRPTFYCILHPVLIVKFRLKNVLNVNFLPSSPVRKGSVPNLEEQYLLKSLPVVPLKLIILMMLCATVSDTSYVSRVYESTSEHEN